MDSEKEIVDPEIEEIEQEEIAEDAVELKETPKIDEPVLVENVHVRGEVTYREIYRHVMFGGALNVSLMALIVLGTLGLCASIGTIIAAGKEPALFYWCAAAFGLIYIPLFKIYPYHYYVKFALARDAEMLDGDPARLVVSVAERAIIIDAPRGDHVEIGYDIIKNAHETKHYLLLKTHSKVIFTVAKDGFTKGSYEELCAILRAKGIKIS